MPYIAEKYWAFDWLKGEVRRQHQQIWRLHWVIAGLSTCIVILGGMLLVRKEQDHARGREHSPAHVC